jgi:hypothetical protein
MGLTTFVLADGTTVERDVSECHTPVVLGEPGDAFENLGLVFHPFNRTLRPARMLLA